MYRLQPVVPVTFPSANVAVGACPPSSRPAPEWSTHGTPSIAGGVPAASSSPHAVTRRGASWAASTAARSRARLSTAPPYVTVVVA